jgi:hypothetical protein
LVFATTDAGRFKTGEEIVVFRLTTHFALLLENIQPPDERVAAARWLPPLVRDYVAKHTEFPTLDPHTRLAGAYAQNLCAGDVKDVDFLVRVPGDPENNEPEPKRLIQNLRVILDDLPEALGKQGYAELQDVTIEGARRSVHVYFVGHDFHLDVVPCIAPNGFGEKLYVPDRGFNRWVLSHPIGYIHLLQELNQLHSRKVLPLGRLLKHFRNVQMIYLRPKSYWLGALLVHHIRKEDGLDMSLSLGELFHDLLRAVYDQYDHLLWVNSGSTPRIPDPMLGHDISWNWGHNAFETFMRRVKVGINWSEKALVADNIDVAIGYWQRIFGEAYFPCNVAEKASFLAAQAWPGRAYLGAAGTILPQSAPGERLMPTQYTTFHGPETE